MVTGLIASRLCTRAAPRAAPRFVPKFQHASKSTLSQGGRQPSFMQDPAHPEDMVFFKRTLGATIVGGSGVLVLSKLWKSQQPKPVSADDMSNLAEIHIGHIRGNTVEIPRQPTKAARRPTHAVTLPENATTKSC